LVDGNPVKPGKERPPDVKLGQGKIKLRENLLRYILHIIPIADVMIGKIHDRLLILAHQLFECKRVSPLAAGDQFAVFVGIWFIPHKVDPILGCVLKNLRRPPQPFPGRLQGGFFFAKTKANAPAASFRFAEKAASGNRCDPDIGYQSPSEFPVVERTPGSVIRHNIIGALRNRTLESGIAQSFQ
jgi:hypothetical protein